MPNDEVISERGRRWVMATRKGLLVIALVCAALAILVAVGGALWLG